MTKLTKRVVDRSQPRHSDYFLWDDEVKGLGLRVWPSGKKSFVFKYQLGGRAGVSTRVTIGDYPAITAELARRQATRLRGDVASGRSPAAERKRLKQEISAERAAATVERFAEDFLAVWRAKKKANTVKEYERLLDREVLPSLGKLRVAAVTRAHVTRLHHAMSDRPYLANRVLAVLSAMFRHAELLGIRPANSNPCAGVERYTERARTRFLTEPELATFGKALARAERIGLIAPEKLRCKPKTGPTAKHRPKKADTPQPANPYAVAALRFLLLTGWREGEALALRWDEIDLKRGQADLSDTRTGRSIRPIGEHALKLLRRLPRLDDSPFVFPGRPKKGDKAKSATHLSDLKRLWESVRHAAKRPDVRLHDLRHTFASVGVSSGYSLPVIGALLGHRDVPTTQRYAHLSYDPRKRAADQIASTVESALNAKAELPRLEVLADSA